MNRPHPRHPCQPKRERSLDRLAELVLGLSPERRAVLERDLRAEAEREEEEKRHAR